MAEEDFIPLQGSAGKKEHKERVNTTLFVSSLPYTATTTDLLTHFSYIGPVRHGFVATDRESGKSKGVGYVTFSLKEDADRAIQELDGGSFGGGNRKIQVKWADERASLKDRKAEVKVSKPIPGQTDNKSTDPKAIQTLVLTGLPSDITKNVLWKKIRKVNDKAELLFPVEAEGSEEEAPKNTAHIIFPSHSDALKALPKLHGHTYKGSILSCVLKKRLEKLSAKGEGKAPSHAGRLIIRNLSWDTTVQDLRKAFLPYGPIHSIDLPTLPSKLPPSSDPTKPPPPPRARGFAFVWFLARHDAEKAIEGINGKPIKKGLDGEGRVVAVDWALSKEKWQEATKGEEKKEGSDSESDSGSESESSSESGEGSDEESSEGSSSDEEGTSIASGSEESSSADENEVEEEEEPVKPTLPTVDVGSTLFIRNLPFETTELELNALFRSFGPLRYAKITIDKATGRSRGTGFVCFWKNEHADEVIEEAQRVAMETGANSIPLGGAVPKNPFALPSLLTADPSSSLASRLVLHGRTLDITRAVTRETASQMKEDTERLRNAADKRNTYLMREGVIFPNSPAAEGLPESEIEKRQASFNSRKALLRGNPSLYISKTRLSIRQLPLFATDRTLKRLAIHAVKAFDKEVADGEREGLARAEEMDATMSAAIAARGDKSGGKGKGKGGKKERETAVIQSKIVRQTEKLDPVTGQGRSKGYGFLEMRSHKDALKVLRWANNNPEVGPLMWEWWKVELGDMKERAEKALTAARKREEEPQKEAAKESKKGLESVEELESRLEKLDSRLEEGDSRSGGGMRGGKTLIIEFSIENVQVVKRRVEKITTARENGKRKADVIAAEDTDDDEPASSKPAGQFDKRAKRDGRDGRDRRDGPGGREGLKGNFRGRQDQNREQGGKFDRDRPKGGQKGQRRDHNDRGGRNERGGRNDRGDRPGQVQPRQPGRRDQKSVDQVKKDIKAKEAGEKRGIEKLGSQLGSLIGRKRKMRKGGK
ncbi:nucleolar protein 4 [Cryptococcus neoformans Tu259-1]|uniref:Nucleolar protein 4 n=1 Tax=Cryptococcus neoformans Tu259-1 TaxID=1230072 RepID=A0A854Q531_CRYNE|nr:nucleolar protein 4 [Cryptococcus neoformans var. grubii Tu259-1]